MKHWFIFKVFHSDSLKKNAKKRQTFEIPALNCPKQLKFLRACTVLLKGATLLYSKTPGFWLSKITRRFLFRTASMQRAQSKKSREQQKLETKEEKKNRSKPSLSITGARRGEKTLNRYRKSKKCRVSAERGKRCPKSKARLFLSNGVFVLFWLGARAIPTFARFYFGWRQYSPKNRLPYVFSSLFAKLSHSWNN